MARYGTAAAYALKAPLQSVTMRLRARNRVALLAGGGVVRRTFLRLLPSPTNVHGAGIT